jgi:hypothetical protein
LDQYGLLWPLSNHTYAREWNLLARTLRKIKQSARLLY